ncbi:MAG: ABC transporter permease [Telluria sp.]
MKTCFSHYFSRYYLFTLHGLQAQLSYRGGFALGIVAGAVGLLAQICLWRAVYGRDAGAVLAGFSLAEMSTYVLVANLLYQMLDNRADHEIAADVMRGDIVIAFVRPLNYPVAKFFACLPASIGNLLFVGLPLCVAGALLFGLQLPGPGDAVLFCLSAALSLAVGFLINAMVGALAFATTNIWGIQVMKTAVVSILSGHLIPLSFFGPTLQRIGELLPFRAMVDAPLRLFLGKYEGALDAAAILGMQLFWVLALGLACAALWRALAGRLEVLGG